ncbi:unnamed protein product [Trifolium pratense]|uniref:Uncharacterized protein n=1 Tax=Trifolium pratense TaxID=57577 RepID=A0ACB0LF11_TRIPR|nr:unnamed protein product [Trifolium pratense]
MWWSWFECGGYEKVVNGGSGLKENGVCGMRKEQRCCVVFFCDFCCRRLEFMLRGLIKKGVATIQTTPEGEDVVLGGVEESECPSWEEGANYAEFNEHEELLMMAQEATVHTRDQQNMRNEKLTLVGWSDSDYAGDLDDRKSTAGYVYMLGSSAVSWSSKKQAIVTLSTTEAEFVAAASCACQGIWLRRILEELGQL